MNKRFLTVPTMLFGAALAVTLASTPAFAAKGDGKKRNPEKMAERMLTSNDTNKDGSLDKSEFKGKPKRFERMDSNNDGKLDSAELKEAINKRQKTGKGGKRKKGANQA